MGLGGPIGEICRPEPNVSIFVNWWQVKTPINLCPFKFITSYGRRATQTPARQHRHRRPDLG